MEITVKKLLVDLTIAIKNNDLEATKKLVADLNSYDDYIKTNYRILDSSLMIGMLANIVRGNESVTYTLNNLNNLETKDEVLWNIQIMRIKTHDMNYIHNFIKNTINNESDWITKNYKFNSLMDLIISTNQNELLNLLQEKLS